MSWRPLWELQDLEDDFLRRVIMAGFISEVDGLQPRVGEAKWVNPLGTGSYWEWAGGGGKVVNALGFQDFPDFPQTVSMETRYITGKKQ